MSTSVQIARFAILGLIALCATGAGIELHHLALDDGHGGELRDAVLWVAAGALVFAIGCWVRVLGTGGGLLRARR